MNCEHHRWNSPRIGHDMELKVYGHYGKPVLVFPPQAGRYSDFEGFGMVDAVRWFIDNGKIKLFAVDSIDGESWSNASAHPADRAWRHEAYDAYVVSEVVPFIRSHCGGGEPGIMTAGCSMGGYHAANFFFRHPDLFDAMISLSGLFQLRHFIGDYTDERVYLNSPLFYLPGLTDPWFLDRYRRSYIVICAGKGAWDEEMVSDAREMERVLSEKGIPAWVDIWGDDVNHDWPWWQKQFPYFLSHAPGVGG